MVDTEGRCLHECVPWHFFCSFCLGGNTSINQQSSLEISRSFRPHHDDYWPGAEFFVVSDAPLRTLFYPEGPNASAWRCFVFGTSYSRSLRLDQGIKIMKSIEIISNPFKSNELMEYVLYIYIYIYIGYEWIVARMPGRFPPGTVMHYDARAIHSALWP